MLNLNKPSLINKLPFLRSYATNSDSYSTYYYRTRLNRISSWEKINELNSNTKDDFLTTTERIEFRNIPFGSTKKFVLKHLGTPRYEMIDKEFIDGHLILFYKFKMVGISIKCELHFIDNYFFLATYTFNCCSEGKNENVESILLTKYLGLKYDYQTNIKIIDKNKNTLIMERGVELNVSYQTGDPEFKKMVLKVIYEKSSFKESQRSRRDKVLENIL